MNHPRYHHNDADEALTAAWRDNRGFTVDLAFRMLGDIGEAEDVVQEAFARLIQARVEEIDDVRGWLVVVVTRLCLDVLRSARVRRSGPVPEDVLESSPAAKAPAAAPDPADRITLDDSVRSALLVVLEKLSPAERTVFVLHDVFGYQFDAIASIVGRTTPACRQLASRARQRIRAESGPGRFSVPPAEHIALAERFIAACAGGDLAALMQLLDPDVAGGIDQGATGRPLVRRGRRVVARNLLTYLGEGTGVTVVTNPLPGPLGLLAFQAGRLVAMFDLELKAGLIHHIEAIRHPARLAVVAEQLGLRPAG